MQQYEQASSYDEESDHDENKFVQKTVYRAKVKDTQAKKPEVSAKAVLKE